VCGDEGSNAGSPNTLDQCDTTSGNRMEDIVTSRLPHQSDIEDTTSRQEDFQLMMPPASATQAMDDDIVEVDDNITTRTKLLTDHLDGSTTTNIASTTGIMEVTSDVERDRSDCVGIDQDTSTTVNGKTVEKLINVILG